MTWLNITSGCVCEMFPEEISISVGKLSKSVGPPQCGWALSNWAGTWIESGTGRLNKLRLTAWARLLIFCSQCSWFQGSKDQAWNPCHQPSGLQPFKPHHQFPRSPVYRGQILGLPISHNLMNQYLRINVLLDKGRDHEVLLVLFLWRTLTRGSRKGRVSPPETGSNLTTPGSSISIVVYSHRAEHGRQREQCLFPVSNSLHSCRDFPEQSSAKHTLLLPQTWLLGGISDLGFFQMRCPSSSPTYANPIIPWRPSSSPTFSMTHSPKMLFYSLHSNDTVFKILHVFNQYLVNVNQIPDPVLDSESLNKNRLYCTVSRLQKGNWPRE